MKDIRTPEPVEQNDVGAISRRNKPAVEQPERPRPNDTRYTKRKVERIVRGEVYDPDFWHRQYPGYELAEARPVYRENTGWSIYLKMWRPDNRPPGKLWRN